MLCYVHSSYDFCYNFGDIRTKEDCDLDGDATQQTMVYNMI